MDEDVTNGPADSVAAASTQALRQLARRAVGRSGADVERIVREARRRARREGRPLGWADIDKALRAGREDMPQDMRWRVAVHEAGHALVYLTLRHGRITLMSVEAAHGGVVHVEAEAHVLETESWVMAGITGRLAGRAAEELVFGDPVAGCGGPPESDLGVATELAVMLEASLGFGRQQPLLHRPMTDRAHLLALDQRLAARVNARLEECYEQAKAILTTGRDVHLWLAETVLRHGVLEGMELKAVLAEARQRLGGRPGADAVAEIGEGNSDVA